MKISTLLSAVGVLAAVFALAVWTGSPSTAAPAPLPQASPVTSLESALLDAMSGGNVIAGPGRIVSSMTNDSGAFFGGENAVGSMEAVLTVQNIGTTSVLIQDEGGATLFGLAPQESRAYHRLHQPADQYRWFGLGDGSRIHLVWSIRR